VGGRTDVIRMLGPAVMSAVLQMIAMLSVRAVVRLAGPVRWAGGSLVGRRVAGVVVSHGCSLD
jgi:hypothetical protein